MTMSWNFGSQVKGGSGCSTLVLIRWIPRLAPRRLVRWQRIGMNFLIWTSHRAQPLYYPSLT